MIKYPRLLNSSGGTERFIDPVKVSVDLTITPLSYASIELPKGENLPARSYVELYTIMGSAGIFRVRSPQDAYGNDTTTAELEHAIVEVGDYLVLNKYSEMMAANTAMQTIFSHYRGSRWQLGNVNALGSGQIALEANYDTVLECMLKILEQKPDCMLTFDFTTSPKWTVAVASRGTTVSAEGRLSRNVNYARVSYDDTELCTRVYYEKPATDSSGNPTSVWAHLDADSATMSQYGLIEKEVNTGSNWTEAEALKVATDYLNKHKIPRVSVEISAEELHSITGETLDKFEIGKLCRLALPDYGVTVENTVTGLSFEDVYNAPNVITVQLAEPEDNAINYIHDVDKKGGSGGGGGGRKKKQDDEQKEYETKIEQSDREIHLWARRTNVAESILEQAGMRLNSQGVLIYATDYANNIMSKLNVQKDRISLLVEGEGANAQIKRASIVASITEGHSSVSITADYIDMNGVVRKLETYDLSCGDITCGNVNCQAVVCDGVVGADGVQAGYFINNNYQEVLVSNVTVSGNTLTITYMNGLSDTFSKATSLSGEWSGTSSSGKQYKVTASQNGTAVGNPHYSPRLDPDGWSKSGNPSWANDKKSFTQDILVSDVDGTGVVLLNDVYFSTLDAWNAGKNSVSTQPTNIRASSSSSGTSLGALSVRSGQYVTFQVNGDGYCIQII